MPGEEGTGFILLKWQAKQGQKRRQREVVRNNNIVGSFLNQALQATLEAGILGEENRPERRSRALQTGADGWPELCLNRFGSTGRAGDRPGRRVLQGQAASSRRGCSCGAGGQGETKQKKHHHRCSDKAQQGA